MHMLCLPYQSILVVRVVAGFAQRPIEQPSPWGRCWLVQSALADADELAGPLHDRDVDEMSEAGSMVSGMSAYTTASTAVGSTVTGSGRPASTVGGRRPQNRKARQKVSYPSASARSAALPDRRLRCRQDCARLQSAASDSALRHRRD